MADKKTFKDMTAALPTTTTDMSKVMVQMADGSVGWIRKEDLAQVAAELMPVATAEKDGLMSSSFFSTDVRENLTLSGNKAGKLVCIASITQRTYHRFFILVKGFYEAQPIMSVININSASQGLLLAYKHDIINKPSYIEFYEKTADNKFNIYIRSTGATGNTSIVRVSHIGESAFPNIGEVCDLDDTFTKIE